MVDQLPQVQLPEINPFSLQVPDAIQAVSPELHEYLVKLNRTLRDQHNRSQAGDTTFDWQVLLGLDSLARYTPGSLGSFSHPLYGLIRARYVRFRATDKSATARIVGFAAGPAGLEWEVVNKPDSAQDKMPVGVIAAYGIPLVGEYGWMITEGVNLSAVYFDKRPASGVMLQWGSGTIGQFLGSEVTLEAGKFKIPAATVRVRLESAGGGGAGVGSGGESIEDILLKYGKQIVELENRLELNSNGNFLFLSILQRRISELTDDRASLEFLEQLQTGANWVNLSGVSAFNASKYARDGQISALATQSYLRDAKVYREESGYYASSAIEFSNAASLNAAEASVSSGQAAAASITAQGYSAQALEYVTLAASVGDNLLKNGTFSDPRWEESQGIPPLWNLWGNAYQKPLIQRYVPGRYGPYALEMNHVLGNTEVGVSQDVPMLPGGNLLGVDLEYISGTLDNSGILIQYFAEGTGALISQEAIKFTRDKLVDGTLNIPYNQRGLYSWSIPVTAPEGIRFARVYLMNHWAGFGSAQDGTHAIWQRVYLKRPAYNPVDPNAGQSYTDARITEVNQAIATEREARGTLSTSVDTRFTQVGGVLDDQNRTIDGVRTTVGSYDQRITSAANAAGAAVDAVETLRTTVDGNTSTLQTYGQSLNGLSTKWGVRTNNNGRITGIELNSGAQSSDFVMVVDKFKMETPGGDVTPFEVSGAQFRLGVDLYVGRFKIILDTGTVMLVLGLGFGSASQFIMWFGPSMNPASCTEGNGIFYLTLTGAAYFGGTLNAGVITNARRTTALDAAANVTTGIFGSNGRSRVVTVSYSYVGTTQVTGQCPANPVPTSVYVDLFRGTDASGALIDSRQFTGSYMCERGTPGDPGFASEDIAGSFSFTDNTGGTSTAFFAQIRNRSINVGATLQTLGIISVEQ